MEDQERPELKNESQEPAPEGLASDATQVSTEARTESPATAGTAWNLAAAVAAWAWPGLGHILTGQRTRGLILMAAIGGLYLAGLLVAGVSAVDQQGQRLAFAGQAMLAPSLAIDVWRSRHVSETPGDATGWDVEPAIGRPLEIGVLYTALAGMLNTLVILDVAHRDPQHAARAKGVTS